MRAESESDRKEYQKRFLNDTKRRIKEVASKDYINPEDGTLDFVLVFIPNEQVFGFMHVSNPDIFDDALKNKVILCSPWTVYPVLSIIRMAIDNFVLERNTGTLFGLMREFDKQWTAFDTCLENMGSRLQAATKEFNQLVSARQSQLDGVLRKIDDLRRRSGFHDRDGQPTAEAAGALRSTEGASRWVKPGGSAVRLGRRVTSRSGRSSRVSPLFRGGVFHDTGGFLPIGTIGQRALA